MAGRFCGALPVTARSCHVCPPSIHPPSTSTNLPTPRSTSRTRRIRSRRERAGAPIIATITSRTHADHSQTMPHTIHLSTPSSTSLHHTSTTPIHLNQPSHTSLHLASLGGCGRLWAAVRARKRHPLACAGHRRGVGVVSTKISPTQHRTALGSGARQPRRSGGLRRAPSFQRRCEPRQAREVQGLSQVRGQHTPDEHALGRRLTRA